MNLINFHTIWAFPLKIRLIFKGRAFRYIFFGHLFKPKKDATTIPNASFSFITNNQIKKINQ